MSEQLPHNSEVLPGDIEFDDAGPEDVWGYLNVYQAAWHNAYSKILATDTLNQYLRSWDSKESLEKGRKLLAESKETTDDHNLALNRIAKINGKIIGLSRFRKTDEGPNKLDLLHILPWYQGLGIGRCLAEDGLAWLGCDKEVELGVEPNNQPAIALYQKLGFEKTDSTDDFTLSDGTVFHQIVMRKPAGR